MSFNALPEDLVAQVASHLEITDIDSLKLTSKRMHEIVKEFHLDRQDIREMSIHPWYRGLEFDILYSSPQNKKEHVSLPKNDDWINQIANMINKCKTLEKLKIYETKIDQTWVDMLSQIRITIPNLHIHAGEMDLDPQGLIDFCKKYKFVKLKGPELKKECITDEVFTQIVPNTFLCYESKYDRIETDLTDATLDALVNDGRIQTRFIIEEFITKFTFTGMRNLMKKFLKGKFRSLEWNFGILPHAMLAEAQNFARAVAAVRGGKFEINRFAGRDNGRIVFDITQNAPPVDYSKYSIEDYPDMYDICLETLDQQWGWIKYAVLDR